MMTIKDRTEYPEAGLLSDRRKPGRRENINSHLIPLLRHAERKVFKSADFCEEDRLVEQIKTPLKVAYLDLNNGRGIVLGVLGGGLIWTAIVISLRSAIMLYG